MILSGIETRCVTFVLHEIFDFLGGRREKFNFLLHLENIYNINFMKFLIISKKSCLQSKWSKNCENYIFKLGDIDANYRREPL